MAVNPRLFVEEDLRADTELTLGKDASHYVATVMRRSEGDGVRLFNGRDGEWQGTLTGGSKKALVLSVSHQLREQVGVPDLTLCFAPVKKARTDFIVEKATELGVATIQPVITARTMAERVKIERLAALAKEAAEQTERLDVPVIAEPVKLTQLVQTWDPNRSMIFADEAGEGGETPWSDGSGLARPMTDVLESFAPPPAGELSAKLTEGGDAETMPPASLRDTSPANRGGKPAAILIGPEGGFAPEERTLLRQQDFIEPVTLGPRILRADTAAVAALTLWQAHLGDWN